LYACREELAGNALVHVLPVLRPRFGRLAVLFPSRRGLTPAARSFADFLKSSLLSLLTPGELVQGAP
jgi:DNA-binding transcriptional LysR family regulator